MSASPSPPPSAGVCTRVLTQNVQFNAAANGDDTSSPGVFTLRRLEDASDVAYTSSVRDLFAEFIRGLGIDMAFQNVDSELADLPGKKYTAEGGGALFVLEHRPAGAPVDSAPALAGCVALKDLGEGNCEAKRLFVRPAYRGLDLGRLLLVHLVDVAKQAGYSALRLDTLARFGPANQLYTTMGFKSIEAYNVNPEADILYFELPGLQSGECAAGREEAFSPQPRRREPRKQ